MTYQKIQKELKIRGILAVMRGKPISLVSHTCGVSRATLYRWMRCAREVIRNSLKQSNADRENKQIKRTMRDIGKQSDSLRSKLRLREAELMRARKDVELLSRLGRPSKCRKCGCEKIYKNGNYRISPDYFSGHLMKGKGRQIDVCHYICPSCKESMSIVDPLKNIFNISSDAERGRIISRVNRKDIHGVKGNTNRGSTALNMPLKHKEKMESATHRFAARDEDKTHAMTKEESCPLLL